MKAPNGLRYLRVGGTRQRRFVGASFEPRELSENAATPTRRVHAVLGGCISTAILLDQLQISLTECPQQHFYH